MRLDKKSESDKEILKKEVAIQIEVKNFANNVMVSFCKIVLIATTKSLLELEECIICFNPKFPSMGTTPIMAKSHAR